MNPLLFGLIDKVIGTVANFIDPTKKAEAELALLKLQQENEFKEIDTALAFAKQQNDINLEQAKNPSLLVSGPRPALMWVGVVGLAYQWIFVPAFTFGYIMYTGHSLPAALPEMNSDMLVMMASLMGLQIGFRSWEKAKGVAAQ
jgi:uncharacterized membrane protein